VDSCLINLKTGLFRDNFRRLRRNDWIAHFLNFGKVARTGKTKIQNRFRAAETNANGADAGRKVMPDAGRKGGDAATPAAKRAAAKKAASAAETRAAAAREADAAAGGGAAAGAAAGTEEGRGSKATYSSDAASHPFAVEGTDGEEGDLLDDALINEISPAKPAPEGGKSRLDRAREIPAMLRAVGDCSLLPSSCLTASRCRTFPRADVLEEAAELGLDQVGKVPLSDSGLVKLAGDAPMNLRYAAPYVDWISRSHTVRACVLQASRAVRMPRMTMHRKTPQTRIKPALEIAMLTTQLRYG
jgi:hypothetical protein